jgi:hypothetical protein
MVDATRKVLSNASFAKGALMKQRATVCSRGPDCVSGARGSIVRCVSAFLVVVAVLSGLVSTPARAAKGDKWFGFQLGGSIPVGDFGDVAAPGLQFGLVGAYSPTEQAEVELGVVYQNWGDRTNPDPIYAELFKPGGLTRYGAQVASVHVTRFSPWLGNVSLYGKGGFGAALVRARLITASGHTVIDSKEYGFNIDVGGGVSVNVRPRERIGIGALYHILQANGGHGDFVSFGMNVMWVMGSR